MSGESQELYQLGFFGLLIMAGNERAELELTDDARARIERFRLVDVGTPNNRLLLDFNEALCWKSPIEADLLNVILTQCFRLCRSLRFIWDVWDQAAIKPISVDEARGALRHLHVKPDLREEHSLRRHVQKLESQLDEWKAQIHRVTHVHPFLVLPEIDRIVHDMESFRNSVYRQWESLAGSVNQRDTSHLLDESHRALRAYYLSHRYGTGATEIGRLIAPHLKDKYGTIANDLKDAGKYLEGFRSVPTGQLIGTPYGAMFADDLLFAVPKFKTSEESSYQG